MKKLYIILGVLAMFVFVASPASAGHYLSPQASANASVGNVTANGGTGGSATATVEEGAVKVKNLYIKASYG